MVGDLEVEIVDVIWEATAPWRAPTGREGMARTNRKRNSGIVPEVVQQVGRPFPDENVCVDAFEEQVVVHNIRRDGGAKGSTTTSR